MVSVFIIPMGMVRSLKHLSLFSSTANGCMLAGTAAIFYYIFFGKVMNPLKPEEKAKWIVWPMERWSLFSGSALCSLEGIGMVSTGIYLILLELAIVLRHNGSHLTSMLMAC